MLTSYTFADAQRFLIKPFERFRFVIIFVLATILGQIVGNFISSQPMFYFLWERSPIQYAIANGIISGLLVGVLQWAVLRKYILDWKWIVVVALNSTFFTSIQTALELNSPPPIVLVGSFSIPSEGYPMYVVTRILVIMGSSLVFGYLQWFILQPYVAKARWWILIPCIAALAGGGIALLGFLAPSWLKLDLLAIGLIILPATQGVGFCLLKHKSIGQPPILQTPLALAPDIANYWDIQRLHKILYRSISRIWKTDLGISEGQLTYLVGVDDSGTKIVYAPMTQTAADSVNQTPLPELVIADRDHPLTAENLMPFAKFQVVFKPPSIVHISAWRNIPLLWFGVVVYAGTIGMSILSTWVRSRFFA
jgi:hypothetical protein